MWMKRYGWDAICRDTDGAGPGGDGTGSSGTSAAEAAQGTGTFGETSGTGSSGTGSGFGGGGATGPAPGEPGANAPSPGSANAQAGQEAANASAFGGTAPDRGSFRGVISRTVQKKKDTEEAIVGALLSAVAPPLGGLFSLAQFARSGVEEFGGTVGPPDSPDSPDAPDGPGPDPKPQPEIARSVRSAGVAPTPAVPAGPTQADLDRERRAQSEERRRRASRRQGRESTIVTGPLGVFGPPQLLRPRAVPGASKRLLGA